MARVAALSTVCLGRLLPGASSAAISATGGERGPRLCGLCNTALLPRCSTAIAAARLCCFAGGFERKACAGRCGARHLEPPLAQTHDAGLRRLRDPLPLPDPPGRPVGFIGLEVKGSKKAPEAKDKT
jgi:hypothetical protein